VAADLPVTPDVVVPAAALSWTSVRASGPGGQNVNKVATKVILRFDPEKTALSEAVKRRLRALAERRLDADGRVQIVSQATRNRIQNLADARQRLAELIRRALVAPKRRRVTQPSRSARRRRVEQKRRQSDKKRLRDKVRS
jgi:ribosome-associated protein